MDNYLCVSAHICRCLDYEHYVLIMVPEYVAGCGSGSGFTGRAVGLLLHVVADCTTFIYANIYM